MEENIKNSVRLDLVEQGERVVKKTMQWWSQSS